VDLAQRAARGASATVTRRRAAAEHLAVAALGLLVLAVHNLPYLLRVPFWTDEAWVAVTTRFPLSQLPAVTSSNPIGWSAVLRLVTVGGSQTGRLLPLAFAGAAVVVAYWLARRLGWPWAPASVIAGLLAAAAALLVPAMLVRDDLKQYTADACLSLLVLALTARLEAGWSRRRLAALSVAIWGGLLFSDAVAFTGAAALGAVCLVQLARRDGRRLAEAVVMSAATAALMAAVYLAFYARAVVPGLTAYWDAFYLPLHRGLHSKLAFVTGKFDVLHAYFGLGPAWLAVPLVIAGLITLGWLGHAATAITVAALWPEMLALSALRKYPFLDLRTSTFLIAITAVVAAIGVAGLCALLRHWLTRAGAVPLAAALAAAAIAAAAAGAFAAAAAPQVRSQLLIPREGDVRDQARYVFRHAAPGDVILVNAASNWGFAYYWPVGRPGRRPDPRDLQGYQAYFPGQPRIIVARDRDPASVSAALAQSLAQSVARARHGRCGRIWLVRTHQSRPEKAAWQAAERQHHLIGEPLTGAGNLQVIQPAGPACPA
jgi:hypothetical protein